MKIEDLTNEQLLDEVYATIKDLLTEDNFSWEQLRKELFKRLLRQPKAERKKHGR